MKGGKSDMSFSAVTKYVLVRRCCFYFDTAAEKSFTRAKSTSSFIRPQGLEHDVRVDMQNENDVKPLPRWKNFPALQRSRAASSNQINRTTFYRTTIQQMMRKESDEACGGHVFGECCYPAERVRQEFIGDSIADLGSAHLPLRGYAFSGPSAADESQIHRCWCNVFVLLGWAPSRVFANDKDGRCPQPFPVTPQKSRLSFTYWTSWDLPDHSRRIR